MDENRTYGLASTGEDGGPTRPQEKQADNVYGNC